VTSPWIVTTNTDRVGLDPTRHGELTFTVTNSTDAADRVVFEPVPGEGVDRSALSVDNPARQVAGGASAAFLVHIAVSPQAPPGRYEMYGQAYSAHLAPEETLGRSGRVVFEVVPEPVPKRRPWWILVVAALVVVVLVVVLSVALHGNGKPAATPSPTPVTVGVPALVGVKQADATAALARLGLKLGKTRIRNSPPQKGTVTDQAPAAGKAVASGSTVDIVVAVDLAALPRSQGNFPNGDAGSGSQVTFVWTVVAGVSTFQILLQRQFCKQSGDTTVAGAVVCDFTTVLTQQVTGTTAAITIPPAPPNLPFGNTPGRLFQWQVSVVDDFGAVGPAGPKAQFAIPA
jgi:hypothetical protein